MVTTLDKFGRILIPKKLREQLGISPNTTLNIREEGNTIIIEPVLAENSIVEKDGILVFTGSAPENMDDVLQDARKSRETQLTGESSQ